MLLNRYGDLDEKRSTEQPSHDLETREVENFNSSYKNISTPGSKIKNKTIKFSEKIIMPDTIHPDTNMN